MRAATKTLKQTRRENDQALNFSAASFGKGPTFPVEPVPEAAPKRRPSRGPEADVLSAVLKALSLHPAVAWVRRINTGAFEVGTGPARRFVRFGFPGCSDVLGQMKDGRLLAVECKSAVGKLSPEQQRFIEVVRENGGVAGMARSVDDALLIIKYGLMRAEPVSP